MGRKGERTQDFQRNWDQETWRSVRRVKDDRNLVTKELKVGGIHGSPPGWWVGRGERQCKTPKERAEETLRLVFWNFTPSLTVLLNRKDKKESHTKLGTEVGVNQLLRLGVILNNMLFCVLTWTKPKKKKLVLFKCIFYILITLKILLEKAMATHSSTLAWKIPCSEEPGRLQSKRSWRVGHDWVTSLSLFTCMHWRRKWKPTLVFLPGES